MCPCVGHGFYVHGSSVSLFRSLGHGSYIDPVCPCVGHGFDRDPVEAGHGPGHQPGHVQLGSASSASKSAGETADGER